MGIRINNTVNVFDEFYRGCLKKGSPVVPCAPVVKVL